MGEREDAALIRELEGALDSQDRREREAGERCGIPWEEHGCDWPSAVAERIVWLRSRVAELERELERERARRET